MAKEYIERKALMHDIMRTVIVSEKKKGYTNPELEGISKVIDRIKAQPTADVQEVRHGKWRKVQNYALCTCCKHEVNWGNDDYLSPYCPNCGTKMDKE